MTDETIKKPEPKIMRMLARGRWIVLEGPKGTGKTTVLNAMRNTHIMDYREEPSNDTPQGRLARSLAASGAPTRAVVEAMSTDRVLNMREVRRRLAGGDFVCQTRTYISTATLQGALSPVDSGFTMTRLMDTQMEAFGCPDLVLWFDIPGIPVRNAGSILWDRMVCRSKAEDGDIGGRRHAQMLDMEQQIGAYRESRLYFERQARRWCTFRNLTPPRSVVVDCGRPLPDVVAQVTQEIDRLWVH